MNVYIRTNCNSKIGLGHLIRTSRLAIEMRKIGLICFFFLDNFYSGKFLEFKKTAMYNNHSKFTNEINDAKLFCKLTKKIKPGIVLVDDYWTWKGSKLATDEYFKQNNITIFLKTIDPFGGVIGVKTK